VSSHSPCHRPRRVPLTRRRPGHQVPEALANLKCTRFIHVMRHYTNHIVQHPDSRPRPDQVSTSFITSAPASRSMPDTWEYSGPSASNQLATRVPARMAPEDLQFTLWVTERVKAPARFDNRRYDGVPVREQRDHRAATSPESGWNARLSQCDTACHTGLAHCHPPSPPSALLSLTRSRLRPSLSPSRHVTSCKDIIPVPPGPALSSLVCLA
jgi:hypothetical protein